MMRIREAWGPAVTGKTYVDQPEGCGSVVTELNDAEREQAIRVLVLAAIEDTMDCLREGFMGYYELRKAAEGLKRNGEE